MIFKNNENNIIVQENVFATLHNNNRTTKKIAKLNFKNQIEKNKKKRTRQLKMSKSQKIASSKKNLNQNNIHNDFATNLISSINSKSFKLFSLKYIENLMKNYKLRVSKKKTFVSTKLFSHQTKQFYKKFNKNSKCVYCKAKKNVELSKYQKYVNC